MRLYLVTQGHKDEKLFSINSQAQWKAERGGEASPLHPHVDEILPICGGPFTITLFFINPRRTFPAMVATGYGT